MRLLLEVLRTVEFLADGPPGLAAEFLALGRSRDLPAGHVFWRPGQSSQGIVIPVSGELASMKSEAGGRQLCYAFFGAGECAGAPCAADGLPHATETRAIRGGEFFVMERAAFLRFLAGRPAVLASVLASVGRLYRRSLEERDRVVFLAVHVRVARFLLEHACLRHGGDGRLLLRLTHAELAGRIGSVREVVARAMAGFAEQGLIRRTPLGVFIVDRAGLRAAAGLDRGQAPDDGRDAEAAAVLTRRFFLPVLQRGSESIADEARICSDHFASLSRCVASGCPLAVALRRGAAPALQHAAATASREHPIGVLRTRLPSRSTGATGPRLASRPQDVVDRGGSSGPIVRLRRLTDRAMPKDTIKRAAHRRIIDHTTVRSPYEDRVIERHVGVYRERVAAIESKFGREREVPASVSVFGEAVLAGA